MVRDCYLYEIRNAGKKSRNRNFLLKSNIKNISSQEYYKKTHENVFKIAIKYEQNWCRINLGREAVEN